MLVYYIHLVPLSTEVYLLDSLGIEMLLMLLRVAGWEGERPTEVDLLVTGSYLVSVKSMEGSQASLTAGWGSDRLSHYNLHFRFSDTVIAGGYTRPGSTITFRAISYPSAVTLNFLLPESLTTKFAFYLCRFA